MILTGVPNWYPTAFSKKGCSNSLIRIHQFYQAGSVSLAVEAGGKLIVLPAEDQFNFLVENLTTIPNRWQSDLVNRYSRRQFPLNFLISTLTQHQWDEWDDESHLLTSDYSSPLFWYYHGPVWTWTSILSCSNKPNESAFLTFTSHKEVMSFGAPFY